MRNVFDIERHNTFPFGLMYDTHRYLLYRNYTTGYFSIPTLPS